MYRATCGNGKGKWDEMGEGWGKGDKRWWVKKWYSVELDRYRADREREIDWEHSTPFSEVWVTNRIQNKIDCNGRIWKTGRKKMLFFEFRQPFYFCTFVSLLHWQVLFQCHQALVIYTIQNHFIFAQFTPINIIIFKYRNLVKILSHSQFAIESSIHCNFFSQQFFTILINQKEIAIMLVSTINIVKCHILPSRPRNLSRPNSITINPNHRYLPLPTLVYS